MRQYFISHWQCEWLCLQNVLLPKESSHPYTMPWLPHLIFSQMNMSSPAFLFGFLCWIVKVSSSLPALSEILALTELVADVLSSTESWLPHMNALILYSFTILKPIMISYVSKLWWLHLSSLNIWTVLDEVDVKYYSWYLRVYLKNMSPFLLHLPKGAWW